MAGILGISYFSVIKAAFIPALLYYFALFLAVDLRALAIGLKGLKKEELPSIKKAILERGHMLIPVILLVALLIRGFSPLFSVFYSIVATMGISLINKKTRISLKEFIYSLVEGAQKALPIATACAVVGFTVGMVGATGLGSVLGQWIIGLAGDSKFIGLILIAVSSLILGMGLPTSASYIMLSVLAVPALVKLGVSLLTANFFVFYFGCLSAITPPVCIAAYTGAAISGGNQFKTGLIAMRIAIGIYIVPYLFVVNPTLLSWDNPSKLIFSGIFLVFAIITISSITEKFLLIENRIMDTILLSIAILLMIIQKIYLINLIGLGIFATVFILQFIIKNKRIKFMRN